MENKIENQETLDMYKELGDLIAKLYKYKPSKELLLDLSKKFPKGSIKEVGDVIDFLDYLSKNILIDGKYLEEYDNYDIALTFFMYLILPRSVFFNISITNENLRKILEVLEDRTEFLKTLLEHPEIKKQVEKAEEEIKEEIQEKKELNSQ